MIGLLITFSIFFSCKKDNEKPKVIYDNASKSKNIVRVDTTQLKVADLPINLTGTDYLIFPIGDLNIYNKKLKSAYASTDANVSFTISNYGEFQITGYLQNLKFQEIGKDTLTTLTDKPVLIQTATFLKSIADKTKRQLLVYTLADLDTNKDNKLDASDIKSLYISEISGAKFFKLSKDYQELIDWKIIDAKNRLYFRAIEDTNRNGEFDKDDNIHYYFVNLTEKEWNVQQYNPI